MNVTKIDEFIRLNIQLWYAKTFYELVMLNAANLVLPDLIEWHILQAVKREMSC